MTGQFQNHLPILLYIHLSSSTHVYLPSPFQKNADDLTVEFRVKKERIRVVRMELIIYATFLLLSLIAYAARQVANKGEEKKVSVSNINFKR